MLVRLSIESAIIKWFHWIKSRHREAFFVSGIFTIESSKHQKKIIIWYGTTGHCLPPNKCFLKNDEVEVRCVLKWNRTKCLHPVSSGEVRTLPKTVTNWNNTWSKFKRKTLVDFNCSQNWIERKLKRVLRGFDAESLEVIDVSKVWWNICWRWDKSGVEKSKILRAVLKKGRSVWSKCWKIEVEEQFETSL